LQKAGSSSREWEKSAVHLHNAQSDLETGRLTTYSTATERPGKTNPKKDDTLKHVQNLKAFSFIFSTLDSYVPPG